MGRKRTNQEARQQFVGPVSNDQKYIREENDLRPQTEAIYMRGWDPSEDRTYHSFPAVRKRLHQPELTEGTLGSEVYRTGPNNPKSILEQEFYDDGRVVEKNIPPERVPTAYVRGGRKADANKHAYDYYMQPQQVQRQMDQTRRQQETIKSEVPRPADRVKRQQLRDYETPDPTFTGTMKEAVKTGFPKTTQLAKDVRTYADPTIGNLLQHGLHTPDGSTYQPPSPGPLGGDRVDQAFADPAQARRFGAGSAPVERESMQRQRAQRDAQQAPVFRNFGEGR